MSVTIRGTDTSAAAPSFTGTDGDTGMFFPAADTIAFAEGGTEAMRIDSSGNVGIGTANADFGSFGAGERILGVSNPTSGTRARLSLQNLSTGTSGVAGTIAFFNGSTQLGSLDVSADGATNKGYYAFNTNNGSSLAERMRIDSSGRVTTPFQPGFRAGLQGSTPSIAAGAIWRFDTASGNGRFNTGGHYNASTYTFTAPVAGCYYFHMQVITEGNANNTSRTDMIILQINGGVAAYSEKRAYYVAGSTGDGGFYVDNVTAIFQLSAGDNVRGANTSPSAATQHANGGYSIFEGYLLG